MDSVGRQPRFSSARRRNALARRRLISALGVCAAVVFVGASIANHQRITLKCIEGTLVAYRGRPFPAGESPVDPSRFPPLAVEPSACRDQPVSSISALEARYVAITLSSVDDAIASDDTEHLESAAAAVDRLGDRPDLEEFMGQRRRALLVSLLESDMDDASAALSRVRARLRAARAAGVSPTVLRALDSELRELLRDATPAPIHPPTPVQVTRSGDETSRPPDQAQLGPRPL